MISAVRRAWQHRSMLIREGRAYEPRWMRGAVTALLVAPVASAFSSVQLGVITLATTYAVIAAYFGYGLIRRHNFSLLELLVAAMLLGSLAGSLLSMPGTSNSPLILLCLIAVLCAWVGYGAAKGLTNARLLGHSTRRERLLHLLAGWYATAAPAMLAMGIALLVTPQATRSSWLIPETFRTLGYLFVSLALLGIILRIWIDRKVSRRAREILKQPSPSQNPATAVS